MGVGAAILGSAVIGGISSKKSADAQKSAASTATQAQERTSEQAMALQKEMFDQQRADFAPWRDAGQAALTKLQSGIESGAFNPQDFTAKQFDASQVDVKQDPGYQFRMSEGVNALDASAAARGRLLSGAQQKGVTNYAQNLASQEYGNAYNRALTENNMQYGRQVDQYNRSANQKANQYNMLASLSQTGQASAAGQAGAAGNLAVQSTNTLSNLGSAQAQSAYNVGQANAGAYQGMAQSANQGIQNWMLYNYMK